MAAPGGVLEPAPAGEHKQGRHFAVTRRDIKDELSSIVDSRLWIRLNADSSLKVNVSFHTNQNNLAHFAAQLLLYDRVIIPTKDFGILPILISWMGAPLFVEALEMGVLGFVRPRDLIGYAGNGLGISGFGIVDNSDNPFFWDQACVYGCMEDAPLLQLRHQCPFLSLARRQKIAGLVLENSKELKLDNEIFMRDVVHESYSDIMSSSHLVGVVLSHEPKGTTSVELSRLTGVDANQMRILDLDDVRDGVDIVLRVAEINMEIIMASLCQGADIGTSIGAELILREKLTRSGRGGNYDKFQSLLELENIPDVRYVVAAGDVSISEIWKIRESREGRRFRKWLRMAKPADARDLEKAYVSTWLLVKSSG